MSVLLPVVGIGYMVPTVVAAYRDHADAKYVFLLNLLLGWTVVGWIAALVWACVGAADVRPVQTRGDRVGPTGHLTLEGGDPRVRDAGIDLGAGRPFP